MNDCLFTILQPLNSMSSHIVWNDAKGWAYWNYHSVRTSASWGSVSCVFIAWVSSGLTSSHGGSNHWWLWHPLFTYMAGNIPLISCSVEGWCWRLSRGEKTQRRQKAKKEGSVSTLTRAKAMQMCLLLEMLRSTVSQVLQWRKLWRMNLG